MDKQDIKIVKEILYSKEDILESKKYKDLKDILNVILSDKKYTVDEVDRLIDKFLAKEVD